MDSCASNWSRCCVAGNSTWSHWAPAVVVQMFVLWSLCCCWPRSLHCPAAAMWRGDAVPTLVLLMSRWALWWSMMKSRRLHLRLLLLLLRCHRLQALSSAGHAHDDAAKAAASCVHRTLGSVASAANASGWGDTRRWRANDAPRRVCPCRWPETRAAAGADAAADAAAIRQPAIVACVVDAAEVAAVVAVADCGIGVGVLFVVVGVWVVCVCWLWTDAVRWRAAMFAASSAATAAAVCGTWTYRSGAYHSWAGDRSHAHCRAHDHSHAHWQLQCVLRCHWQRPRRCSPGSRRRDWTDASVLLLIVWCVCWLLFDFCCCCCCCVCVIRIIYLVRYITSWVTKMNIDQKPKKEEVERTERQKSGA